MSWPSSGDPYYLANQTDNDARRGFYVVNSTPTLKCDGSACGTSQYAITSAINSRLAVPSNIWLDLELEVVGTNLNATCNAVTDIDISGNCTIHFVLLEQYKYLPSPNGNPNHYHAMLKMAPSASGQLFSATAYDTVHYYATFELNPAWALDNLDLACFVQNNTTREIYQAKVTAIPLDFPNILLFDYQVSDPAGNQDGRVDPGETGELVAILENQAPFHDATEVQATLATDDPLIDVLVPTINYPDLASGAAAGNYGNPFQFYVDPAFEAHEVTFTITATAEPGAFEATYPLIFMVGRPDILLVNDDILGAYQSFYEQSLEDLGRVYDAWNQAEQGVLPQDEMNRYLVLIWYTGDDATSTLSPDEQQKIENFLSNGGRLFLSSQNAGDVLSATAFYEDVLHAQHLVSSTGEYLLDGVAGDPVSGGTSLSLVGAGGAGNANSSSSFEPLWPAVGIYTYTNAGTFGALRCQTDVSRIVYFALAFEAVSGLIGTTPRSEVLDNCLVWLEGEVMVDPSAPSSTRPHQFEIASVYPNPFNPSSEIKFSLPASSYVILSVFDLQGRLIQNLYRGVLSAGGHSVIWNAESFSSGIYIVTLSDGQQSGSTKVVLLK